MHSRSRACVSLLLALVTACAGSGHQNIPRPDEGAPVLPDRCRVYVVREDVITGSVHNVRVFDGDDEIGTVSENEYLCWDRRPQQGIGSLVFEGFEPKLRAVENVFDLPREGGSTSWFTIEIPLAGRQPQVKKLSPEEGRELIARCKPARR